MKKIVLTTLILLSTISVFTQEKTIDKTVFDKIYDNSYEQLRGKSYRTTTVSDAEKVSATFNSSSLFPKDFQEGSPELRERLTLPNYYDSTSKIITEFAPPDVVRTLYKSAYSRIETIKIGDKLYKRKGDGEWKEEKPDVLPQLFQTIDEQVEYKFLGNEVLKNQKASVYKKIENKKLATAKSTYGTSSVTTTFWFAEDGRLLSTKMESITRHNATRKEPFRRREVTTFELDPNIKIEAPKTK